MTFHYSPGDSYRLVQQVVEGAANFAGGGFSGCFRGLSVLLQVVVAELWAWLTLWAVTMLALTAVVTSFA